MRDLPAPLTSKVIDFHIEINANISLRGDWQRRPVRDGCELVGLKMTTQ